MSILPSTKCWIKALKLFAPTYAGVIIFNLMFWWLLLPLPIAFDIRLFIAACVFAGIGLVLYVIFRALYAGLLRLLWRNPPQWLRPAPWRKTFLHFGVSLLATLPLALIVLAIVGFPRESGEIYVDGQFRSAYAVALQETTFRFSWLWIIMAACIYSTVKPSLD
jgi:hypothetical protein